MSFQFYGVFLMIRTVALLAIAFCVIPWQPARGAIIGFGSGSGYTLNSYGNATPSINAGTLTLTSFGNSFQAASAFYNTPQNTGSFTAQFTYRASGSADGGAFVIQRDPTGVAALGGCGSGLGYAPDPSDSAKISNSVALEMNFYVGTGGSGTYLSTQGASGQGNYLSTGPVGLGSSDPINVSLTYDATAHTLSETLTDALSPTTTYSHTFSGINIASQVNNSTAFVGFTAGNGGLSSTQTVSNFQFQSTAPEPSTLALLGIGAMSLLAYAVRKRNQA